MRSKRILKFYFGADKLDKSLNDLILKRALSLKECDAEAAADGICELIWVKGELGGLWAYLDGAFAYMTGREREVLENYAAMRRGISKLDEGEQREIKRVTVKFFRRARNLKRFARAIALVDEYFAFFR